MTIIQSRVLLNHHDMRDVKQNTKRYEKTICLRCGGVEFVFLCLKVKT
jgi:hypothetical protein